MIQLRIRVHFNGNACGYFLGFSFFVLCELGTLVDEDASVASSPAAFVADAVADTSGISKVDHATALRSHIAGGI